MLFSIGLEINAGTHKEMLVRLSHRKDGAGRSEEKHGKIKNDDDNSNDNNENKKK